MYRVDMYYTIKTLSERGYSKRKISKELGIHRNTVNRILEQASVGKMEPEPIARSKLLDQYKEHIEELIERRKTAVLIHEDLTNKKSVKVAYPTVVKYVRELKRGEVYVPIITDPGQEAQVDFGYLGRFNKDGKMVKVWVFSMVLSHSRYSFSVIVLDQSVKTFIWCHILAFEFFGGVPAVVLLDNLKAGVISPSFFEPVIQHQYAAFLEHYGSAPITARIGRGQDKGKVESGIKYVKNNFLKRIDHRDYYRLQPDLDRWTKDICNQRIHGTTRKVPARIFESVEKKTLLPLPAERFTILNIEKRKANAYAHITYQYNYYSVPHQYAGKELVIQCSGSVVKIYWDNDQVAIHALHDGQGAYIIKEEHKPPYKQRKSREYYEERITAIGSNAILFMQELEQVKPRHWHEMLRGILSLEKQYDKQAIDLSCARALSYGAISYREVKNILEQQLYQMNLEEGPVSSEFMKLGGYGHDLSTYDKL